MSSGNDLIGGGAGASSEATAARNAGNLLWAWALIAVLGIADWIWAERVGFSFVGWPSVFSTLAILGLIGGVYGFSGRSQRLTDAGHFAALWVAFSVVGCIFTYLAADLRLPLRDQAIARFDEALGFNWYAWSGFIEAHRVAHLVLECAYLTFLPQIVGALLYFAHTEQTDRNRELLWIGMVSLIVTTIISAFAPALGPYARTPPPWTAALISVRSGLVSIFKFDDMQGIITMPSFHAAIAIELIYVHRPPSRSFLPLLLLNILMLVSIPSCGHHYLTDGIAGIAVAALSIAIVRAAARIQIGVPQAEFEQIPNARDRDTLGEPIRVSSGARG
ncbi:MAG TPA: phosphatase PAP2 family protein [Candidatus Binataceae bacterium]|nr:phosphatase PAP2 family protein [Candidatus Binataceae bacterium]